MGEKVDEPLTAAKDWLIANNNNVMAVLFVVIGFMMIGDSLSVLL
jgi:hypothetical protein